MTTSTPIVSSAATNGGPQPTGTVTVTLLDGTSPVAGKTVTLECHPATDGGRSRPASQVTGSNGQASFSVSDTTAEVVTFSAVDTTDANLAIAGDGTGELPGACGLRIDVGNQRIPDNGGG